MCSSSAPEDQCKFVDHSSGLKLSCTETIIFMILRDLHLLVGYIQLIKTDREKKNCLENCRIFYPFLPQIIRTRRSIVWIWTILESMFYMETSLPSPSLSLVAFCHVFSVVPVIRNMLSGVMRVTGLPFFVSWLALRAQKQLSSEKKSKLALLAAEPSRNWFAEALTYSNETLV